jgi:MerR family transcriptional regulator, redox-sensitive transcriptional activator SoxR
MQGHELISIGHLSRRTGLTVSAIRFYEAKKLVTPERNRGGQRRFLRADIRRLSFVMIAQRLGFSLAEIKTIMLRLPQGRTPTKQDWSAIARKIGDDLDQRILMLTRLREKLDGCIGCGCLSLKTCALYNPQDRANRKGQGPRYLLGDKPT